MSGTEPILNEPRARTAATNVRSSILTSWYNRSHNIAGLKTTDTLRAHAIATRKTVSRLARLGWPRGISSEVAHLSQSAELPQWMRRNGAAAAQRNGGPAAAKDTNAVAPSSSTVVALLRYCNDAERPFRQSRVDAAALLSEACWRPNMPGCWPRPAEIAVQEAAIGRGPVRARWRLCINAAPHGAQLPR
jgi:hypothetical protein